MLRHLDDADLDRPVEAATAEARRRGRQAGKTSGGRARARPVTQGQEKPILAAFEAGLRPAAIAREFRVSRARVDATRCLRGQLRAGSASRAPGSTACWPAPDKAAGEREAHGHDAIRRPVSRTRDPMDLYIVALRGSHRYIPR